MSQTEFRQEITLLLPTMGLCRDLFDRSLYSCQGRGREGDNSVLQLHTLCRPSEQNLSVPVVSGPWLEVLRIQGQNLWLR